MNVAVLVAQKNFRHRRRAFLRPHQQIGFGMDRKVAQNAARFRFQAFAVPFADAADFRNRFRRGEEIGAVRFLMRPLEAVQVGIEIGQRATFGNSRRIQTVGRRFGGQFRRNIRRIDRFAGIGKFRVVPREKRDLRAVGRPAQMVFSAAAPYEFDGRPAFQYAKIEVGLVVIVVFAGVVRRVAEAFAVRRNRETLHAVIAGEQQFRLALLDFDAPELSPQALLVFDYGVYFAAFALLFADAFNRLRARFRREIDEAFAVRQPVEFQHAFFRGGDFAGFAAVYRQGPDLRCRIVVVLIGGGFRVGARGEERQIPSVRRPARRMFAFKGERQLPRRGVVSRVRFGLVFRFVRLVIRLQIAGVIVYVVRVVFGVGGVPFRQPQMADDLALVEIGLRHSEGDAPPVRVNLRVAQALHFKEAAGRDALRYRSFFHLRVTFCHIYFAGSPSFGSRRAVGSVDYFKTGSFGSASTGAPTNSRMSSPRSSCNTPSTSARYSCRAVSRRGSGVAMMGTRHHILPAISVP